MLLEATALGQERDHGKAVELLRTLLDGNPRNCLALDILGFHLMQLGAFEEALDALQRRLACGAERADTWLNVGICHDRLGEPERALEAVQRGLTIDPGHAQVRAELARLLDAAGRSDEAASVRAEARR